MASRRLDDLAPPVRRAALELLEAVRDNGLELLIYCTVRSNEEQAALYAQGRTKPGRRVTNAPPGQSMHNPDKNGHSWAFDAVPLRAGKPLWDDDQALALVGKLGQAAGLEWSGAWSVFPEKVHFQGTKKMIEDAQWAA